MAAVEDSRAVFVSNISPNATEKTVSDFFSFCGRITRLALKSVDGGVQEAVVVFETDSAAKTALLLTNALIVDRPITVVSYVAKADEPQVPVEAAPQAVITERQHAVPDAERTKTSVIASLVAAGYVLGSDTIQKARDIDEKHMISLQLNVAAEQIKAKANEVDKALHISETATAIKTGVVEKAKEVDGKLHLTEKVDAAVTAAKFQANAFAAKAQENETIAKGVGLLKAVGNNIQNQIQSFKDETSKAIDEKIQEKEGEKVGSPRPAAVAVVAGGAPAVAQPVAADAGVGAGPEVVAVAAVAPVPSAPPTEPVAATTSSTQ